jgi:hypothetical protein
MVPPVWGKSLLIEETTSKDNVAADRMMQALALRERWQAVDDMVPISLRR